MSKKNITIEKDLNVIALDYLNISGAKDLLDLQENHKYFWEKYEEEKNRITSKKIIAEILSPKTQEEKNEILTCSSCKKALVNVQKQQKIYFGELIYKCSKEQIKVVCSCGEINLFDLKVGG